MAIKSIDYPKHHGEFSYIIIWIKRIAVPSLKLILIKLHANTLSIQFQTACDKFFFSISCQLLKESIYLRLKQKMCC